MLRHALRRVLWSVPTLLATSLVLFFVTTLAPGPLDPLPRFLNLDPLDVRALAKRALSHVAAADESQEVGKRELRRLGGAALPYVLPQLEALAPDARRRVALALSPLAERMQLSVGVDLTRPEAAVLFWTRFWDDRALDFSTVAVNRAVTRLVEHGTDLRESDLLVLDTLALPVVIRAMANTTDPLTLARLTQDFRHKTGLTRFLPAILCSTETGPLLTPVRWHGSGDVAALTRANAFLVADAGRSEWKAGDLMRALPK